MASIKSIHIEGYRSLENVTLEPGRITVLIGPNGAGKSNLLSALRTLHRLPTRSLRYDTGLAGGASKMLHYGPKQTPTLRMRIDIDADQSRYAYDVGLRHAEDDTFVFAQEHLIDLGPTVPTVRSLGSGHSEALIGRESQTPDLAAQTITTALLQIQNYHFHDTSRESPMRQHGRQEDTRALRYDGGNLSSYLHQLANGTSADYRAAWARINSLVDRFAPFIKTLDPTLVMPDRPDDSAIRLDWIDDRDERFRVSQLSDGTLRAIALTTALMQPREQLPGFIVIDEPELGLHPLAISLVAAMIRSISVHSQVLIATQSPALIDEFAVEDVVVAERAHGATTLRRVDRGALAIWLDEYTLSEIWEKNLIGGNP